MTIEDNSCAAGDVAPPLNNNETAFCGDFTVGLDTYFAGTRPDGAILIWTTDDSDPLDEDEWAPTAGDSDVSEPGSYYAFFLDEANDCFSPLSEVVITQNAPPSAGTVTTPVEACNNDTSDFGPNRIDLDNLIEDEDDGDWVQTGGPDLGALPNNNDLDFRGEAVGSYEFTYTTDTAEGTCVNESSVVTINVTDCDPCLAGNVAPVLNEGVPTTFCGEIEGSLNDYAPNTGPNGTVLRWATTDDEPLENLVTAARIAAPLEATYFGFYFDEANDCISPLLTLSLNQNDIPEITGTTDNSRCGPGTLQLSATRTLNATLRWFSNPEGGAEISDGANFTTPNISNTTLLLRRGNFQWLYLRAHRSGRHGNSPTLGRGTAECILL